MVISTKQLKALRRELKLTKAALAVELAVTEQAVKNWESERRSCKAGSALRVLELAAARGVVLAQLAPVGANQVNHRPKYANLGPRDWAAASKYGWCELKYDGHYAEIKCGPGGWTATGRRGDVIMTGSEPLPTCHLLAECIVDTEWAEDMAPGEGLCDMLVVWGALNRNGIHISRGRMLALVDKIAAAGVKVAPSERFELAEAPDVWASDVCDFKWEGLIFRTAGGRFARMKHRETMDYVCMGAEGGSLIGGLFSSRGKLVDKVRVPCPDPPQVDDVFEASGLAVTRRGSLRNPRWERWRPDKAPEDCTR